LIYVTVENILFSSTWLTLTMFKLIFGRSCIIACVISIYAVFALPNIYLTGFNKAPETHYQYLTDGFLSGQLSLTLAPTTALLNLADAYDPTQNDKLRYQDASLYHGKYYLYFGPLPVLAFYLPFKLITDLYPPDALCILFFISIGFIANFLLLIQIRNRYFQNISELQLYFIGLLVGLANNAPTLLIEPRVYETAIASSYCAMSIAFIYLYKTLTEKPKAINVIIFSTCISLAVAGRAHFILVCLLLTPLLAFYFLKYAPKNQLKHLFLSLLAPTFCVGVALAAYNYLRFDSFMEFGRTYQLGMDNFMHFKMAAGDAYHRIPLQIYYYFIQPFFIQSPHAIPHWLLPFIRGTTYEFTVGIMTTTPLVILMFVMPVLYKMHMKNNHLAPKSLWWFLALATLTPVIVLLFLLLIAYTAQRYESDFLPYLMIAAVINLWLLQKYTIYPRLLTRVATVFFVLTGIISILIGVDAGMMAYGLPWSVVVFSRLTILQFALTPLVVLLTYIMMRSIAPRPYSPLTEELRCE
jgi:hypothetical protein